MIAEVALVAIVFGLAISAGLYFTVVWPRREPDDFDDEPPTSP